MFDTLFDMSKEWRDRAVIGQYEGEEHLYEARVAVASEFYAAYNAAWDKKERRYADKVKELIIDPYVAAWS